MTSSFSVRFALTAIASSLLACSTAVDTRSGEPSIVPAIPASQPPAVLGEFTVDVRVRDRRMTWTPRRASPAGSIHAQTFGQIPSGAGENPAGDPDVAVWSLPDALRLDGDCPNWGFGSKTQLCSTVAVVNRRPGTIIRNLYIHITDMRPASTRPESDFYGNNSDPILPDHAGAIPGNGVRGIWYYGHVGPGANNQRNVDWALDNPREDFHFTAQVLGDRVAVASCDAPAPELSPDLRFADENCDGVDGVSSDTNASRGIFVDGRRGNDARCDSMLSETGQVKCGNGSLRRPYQTIDGALRDRGQRRNMYVAAGTYTSSALWDVPPGFSIWGGYRGDDGFVTRATTSRATLRNSAQTAIRFQGSGAGSLPSTLQLLSVVSGNGTANAKSSNGIRARGATVRIEEVDITAGRGFDGASPAGGGAAARGVTGTSATTTDGAAAATPQVCRSGNGGAGGRGGAGAAFAVGGDGVAAGSAPGGSGGNPDDGESQATAGLPGANGAEGVFVGDGVAAPAALTPEMFTSGLYEFPPHAEMLGKIGANGLPGAGGGAGGASGAIAGGGGGAGGAGGCGGGGGPAGEHGGGSFGIVAVQSTITFGTGTSISVVSGGGRGGNGGNGESGGLGGAGGAGFVPAGDRPAGPGGSGGNGGRGSRGGGGAGGNGGPAVCVVMNASAMPATLPTCARPATGAPGGIGGNAPVLGAPGNPGITRDTLP